MTQDKHKTQIRLLWMLVFILVLACGGLAYQLYVTTAENLSSPANGTTLHLTDLQYQDMSPLPGGVSAPLIDGALDAPMLQDLVGRSDTGEIKMPEDLSQLGDGVVERVGGIPVVDLQKASGPPELPFLTLGCEGECCGILNSNILKKEVAFRSLPDVNSPISKTLPKAYEIRNPQFYLKVKEYGESSVIMHDGVRKTVKGIFYLGEGNIFVWDGSKFASMEEFRGVENGFSESWLRANDQEGNSGWILLDGGPGEILELGWCG